MTGLGKAAGFGEEEYTARPGREIFPRKDGSFVHMGATVDDTVRIGPGTKVWQHASVIRYSQVGARCNIATCSIVDGARVGDDCLICHGAFIDPGIVIGNRVFIGPNVSLCNDYWPRVEKEGWFNIEDLISGKITVTMIGDGASIGANAVVMPGRIIGMNAMVAAGAVVTSDVPAGYLYRRDGSIVLIEPDKTPSRMRVVARGC